jgi:hypothetical protein
MEYRKYYLREFVLYDGEHDITFNIVDINTEEITVAITDEGKISVRSFDLKVDSGRLYFTYGIMLDEIAVKDFKQIKKGE